MPALSPPLLARGDSFAWSLIAALPDATVIVDGRQQIVFANDRAGELFGDQVADLLGRGIDELVPTFASSDRPPLSTVTDCGHRVHTTDGTLDVSARRRDGTEVAVEITLRPLHLGDETFTVAAIREVGKRTAADAQLQRVLRTLNASDDAIFIFDATTLVFLFVNDAATRLTGYERRELLEMTPLHLNPGTTEEDERLLVQPLIGGEEASVASLTTMVRKDGSTVVVETTYHTAQSSRDTTTWVITLARDVTARLARDGELARSQRALANAETVANTKAAISDDRERIARDLHDTVIQRLFGEGLSLQATLPLLHENVANRIRTTIDGLDETIKELRMAVFSLQGPSVGGAPGGLRGRLLAAIDDSTSALGFEPRLQFDGPIETIDDHTADELLHVLREALSNVARHATAHSVRVGVKAGEQVTLTLVDDGVGIPDEVLGGRGIRNMNRRAHQLGGRCTITNRPTGGTALVWQVPNVSRPT